jgi:hypothetical protein
MHQALELVALNSTSNPSVQEAIQHFFLPHDLEVRCCDGTRDITHKKQFWCEKGDAGVVFYGSFSETSLQQYDSTDFQIEDEIRLPFGGPSSGKQSSYELIGFTARIINRGHHVAIIYDDKGTPWTFDDDEIYKGLPKESWVPGLIFYDLWEAQAQTCGVDFLDLQIGGGTRESSSPNSPSDSDADSEDPARSNPPPPLSSVTKSGRRSYGTNKYKPEEARPKKTMKPVKAAISNQVPLATLASDSNEQESARATTSDHESNSNDAQYKSGVQPASQNELVGRFPAGTWVWVKKVTDYLVARIIAPKAVKSMCIEWACDSQKQQVSNKRILRLLEVREERIVFGLQHDQGRNLTLSKIEALLNSQGGLRISQHSSRIPSGQEHDDSDPELVFTAATVNWDSLALPWLLQQDSSFDPTALIGRSWPLPSKVPYECFSANQEFPAHPSFGNCFRELALLIQQIPTENRLYQLLFAWIHLLPILLLRAAESCSSKELVKLIAGRCTLLMQGEWAKLYAKALKDAQKIEARAVRQRAQNFSAITSQTNVQRAEKCIRRGNLSKGARILTGEGISKDPNAYNELLAKHPQDVPAASFPLDYVLPPIPELSEADLNKYLSLPNLARVAGAFPAESHPDQWGWRPREYIAHMLHDPGTSGLVYEVLIRPRYEGKLPGLYGECYRGGKLIALSKAPKPGNRPIAIGDVFRRLLDKALQPLSKKDLAYTFEHSYHNVKQFASGSSDGAEKYIITALLALQEDPAPSDMPNNPHDDPMAIFLLDQVNAYNELQRQVVVDMITRKYEGSYAQGRLTKDNTIVLPDVFAAHIPSIRGHYEGDGRLVFVDASRQPRSITSRTGTQQGCVMGGKLFNIGTFSVIGASMADHPEVYCSMFSDNIALVGRLSKCFKAADDLRLSLHEIGLRLQPADSTVYIPSYIKHNEPPQILIELQEQYPELSSTPWSKDGVILLGCPFGTDEFVHRHMEKICDRISHCSEHFSAVGDGLIHFQLHKFSVNAMLPYFLRTANPVLSTQHAQRVDALIWKAILNYAEVSSLDSDDPSLQGVFRDARRQVAMRIGEGGFGLTPNECVVVPAFYSALSSALRFAACCGFLPISQFIASPAFRALPLCVTYVKARDDLIQWGAKEPEQQDAASQSSEAQGDGGTNGAMRKKPKPVILPTLEDIITHTGAEPLVFPDQKVLTRLAHKAHPEWCPDGLTSEGKTRTKHLSKQTIKAHGTDDETAAYLQGIAGFSEDQELYHSPLTFLTHTESLEERFPRDVFAVVLSYLLGLPVASCLQKRETTRCEACDEPLDRFGHHRMTCKKTAMCNASHTQLAKAFADIARKSGVPYSDKGVPSHLTSSKKVGDALCILSSDSRQLVLDYSIVHPRHGTPNAAGQWYHEALANRVRQKWNHHGRPYATIGFAFAPCVMTTYGRMDAHLLRLLYILAKKRAHLVHVHHRPFSTIESLFGRFFAQSRARVGAAVARGMALRALGVSALGVSKVFLKHVAPARYRDQTLSAGPHLSAGHSQWRLTLSL